MDVETLVSEVLNRADYRALFAARPTPEVLNQRLRANAVPARVTDVRRYPEGGYVINYVVDERSYVLFHPGWA